MASSRVAKPPGKRRQRKRQSSYRLADESLASSRSIVDFIIIQFNEAEMMFAMPQMKTDPFLMAHFAENRMGWMSFAVSGKLIDRFEQS